MRHPKKSRARLQIALVFSLIMLDYGFYAYEQAAEIPALFTGGISILSVVLAFSR